MLGMQLMLLLLTFFSSSTFLAAACVSTGEVVVGEVCVVAGGLGEGFVDVGVGSICVSYFVNFSGFFKNAINLLCKGKKRNPRAV